MINAPSGVLRCRGDIVGAVSPAGSADFGATASGDRYLIVHFHKWRMNHGALRNGSIAPDVDIQPRKGLHFALLKKADQVYPVSPLCSPAAFRSALSPVRITGGIVRPVIKLAMPSEIVAERGSISWRPRPVKFGNRYDVRFN